MPCSKSTLGAPGDRLNPIPAASIRRELRRTKERIEIKKMREAEDRAFLEQMRGESHTSGEEDNTESDGYVEPPTQEEREAAERRLAMLR